MYVTVFDNCLFSVEISIDIGFKVSVNYLDVVSIDTEAE